MIDYYILDDNGIPIPATDLLAWAKWMEAGDRKLAMDKIEDVVVSTVFLGLNHAFGGPVPILWETMIFGGPHDQYQERYSSEEDALAGHARALALAEQTEVKT